MTPSPTRFGRSAYTVFGGIGYGASVAIATSLAVVWELTLGERLVVMLAPPLAFIAITTVATALKGREWIVFYQTAAGAIASTWIAGRAIGANLPRLADVVVIGIGTFLVFGRIGCFHVGCCHGRPARFGVRYDQRHVARGLWSTFANRPLWPVQLFEAGATALITAGSLLAAAEPGRAAYVFAVSYGMVRFCLELGRGDPVRPFAIGISEAQWWCLASAILCAIAHPSWWTVAAPLLIAAATFAVATTRRRRELAEPSHAHELETLCAEVRADPFHTRRETTLGLAVSCHVLPDNRLDWILSSAHPAWSLEMAKRLSGLLWPLAAIVPGRTGSVVHIIDHASAPRNPPNWPDNAAH